MKKEKQPLTTREKVLIGVGVVATCAAGYLGYKYWTSLKDCKVLKAANNQEVINDITKEALEETTKELNFLKFLVIEGNIVPHAKQNGKNKLERVKTKMARLEKHIATYGAQKDSITELNLLKSDEIFLINCLEKAEKVQEMIDNDSLDYAK